MRAAKKFVLGIICAGLVVVMGATGGFVVDDIRHAVQYDPSPLDRKGLEKQLATIEAFERVLEVICLGNVIQHEAGGESLDDRRIVGMIFKARRDDRQNRWPKSIRGIVAQKGAVSGFTKDCEDPAGLRKENVEIARAIYYDPWQEQLLPAGFECVRSYALAEEIIRRMKPADRKKLGITKEMKGYAYLKRTHDPVARFGKQVAWAPKGYCKPLPSTSA